MKKLPVLLALLSSISITACNSGTAAPASSETAVYTPPNTVIPPLLSKKVHGLPNLGNSCYMNAALQILVNSPALRREVLNKNPKAKFLSFFDAYDSNDMNSLITNHQDIANYIYSLPGIPLKGQQGSSIDVLSGDSLSFNGLDLPSKVIDPSNTRNINSSILNFLKLGIYLFSFQDSTNYSTTIEYKEIPFKDKVIGFSYNSGGHYISFIKLDNQWYSINDSVVSTVTKNDLYNLSKGLTKGIEVISYM